MIKKIHKPLLVFFVFIMAISCQKEVNILIEPSINQTLKANTTVATLVKNTTTKDGSIDNIIDRANCLSVKLPVTVFANQKELTIASEADYLLIENIFDESDDDTDTLTIIFPITIISSNFSSTIIQNLEELKELSEDCKGENEDDYDIECIDFVYPITFSIYNSSSQITETLSIQTDEQFYNLLEDLEDYYIVQINFPIAVVLYNGEVQTINNMNELETAIEQADGMCDEDDDYDYSDDDCGTCTFAQINTMLLNCKWVVEKLEINEIDKTEQYNNLDFTFVANGTVNVKKEGNTTTGTWQLSGNNAITLTLNIPGYTDFNFSWNLHEMSDGNELEFKLGENKLNLEQKCN